MVLGQLDSQPQARPKPQPPRNQLPMCHRRNAQHNTRKPSGRCGLLKELGLKKGFLDRIAKAQSIKGKPENFRSVKDTTKKMRKQAIGWKKYLQTTFLTRLVCILKTSPVRKWATDMKRRFTRRSCRWQTSPGDDTQHHGPWGNGHHNRVRRHSTPSRGPRYEALTLDPSRPAGGVRRPSPLGRSAAASNPGPAAALLSNSLLNIHLPGL